MKIKVLDMHFAKRKVVLAISFKEWLKLKLFPLYVTYAFHSRKEGWNGTLPFYIVKCADHGYFLAYPSGYSGDFYCPLCIREWSNFETNRGGEIVK